MRSRDRPTWNSKFGAAFAGLAWAIRTQSSFWVHALVTIIVIALAAWLQLELWQWATLTIVIGLVWAAELINTAIETLVLVLHPEWDERIGRALDAAAAGVLVASITAVAVGLVVLGPSLYHRLSGLLN